MGWPDMYLDAPLYSISNPLILRLKLLQSHPNLYQARVKHLLHQMAPQCTNRTNVRSSKKFQQTDQNGNIRDSIRVPASQDQSKPIFDPPVNNLSIILEVITTFPNTFISLLIIPLILKQLPPFFLYDFSCDFFFL